MNTDVTVQGGRKGVVFKLYPIYTLANFRSFADLIKQQGRGKYRSRCSEDGELRDVVSVVV